MTFAQKLQANLPGDRERPADPRTVEGRVKKLRKSQTT
jgi:hypothetical protein